MGERETGRERELLKMTGASRRERQANRREREGERERALLGTMVHNGGSRAAPAHGLRITTRFPASPPGRTESAECVEYLF